MNVAALLHESPSNPPRKPPSTAPNDPPPRVAQQSPQASMHPLPHRPKSPAMSSLHPQSDPKPTWQQGEMQEGRDGHEDHWEQKRRERADSGPLPSIRNTAPFEHRPPSLPPKPLSKRDLEDMNIIRAAANARQQQQHQQGSLAELVVLGPGTAPRPSSSSGRVQSSVMGPGSELGRDRDRTEWERLHPHPHSQQHRVLPPPPQPTHPHQARPIPAPVPMHAPRDHVNLDAHRERREREQHDALRKDQDPFARRHSQNQHPIPQHHATIGRHAPPSRTSSAGLMDGRLSGGPTRGTGDEHQFSFPPNHRDANRESEQARLRRKEREKEKEKLVREPREPQRAPITPVPEPQPRPSLLGAAKHSLGVIEDMETTLRVNVGGLSIYDEPEQIQETIHLGTFIWPKSPFPFFFPQHHMNQPRSYVATIYVPSGCLPLERPKRSKVWGGGVSPRARRGARRVYTDDSDVFLCALHAGWITWSATRKAKEEGKDLELQVKMIRCLRDAESAAPGQPFIGIFPGGWGEQYRHSPPKSHDSSRHRRQRKPANKGYDDVLAEPKKRLEELIGEGDESEEDDGRSFLSAGWGSSHDGSGIEVINAKFIEGTARRFGRLNRRQRLAEYSQRRMALLSQKNMNSTEDIETEQKTLIIGYTAATELSLGYKYHVKALKRALLSDCSSHETGRPQKRRRVVKNGDMDTDERKTRCQIFVETAEDCYVFTRSDGTKPTFDLSIKLRHETQDENPDKVKGMTHPPSSAPSAVDNLVDQVTPRPFAPMPLSSDTPTTPVLIEKVSSPPASPIDSIASTPKHSSSPPNTNASELPAVHGSEPASNPGIRPAPAELVTVTAPEREVEEGELPEDEPVPPETVAAPTASVTAPPASAPSETQIEKTTTLAPRPSDEQGSSQVEVVKPQSPLEAGHKELHVVRSNFGEELIRFTDAGIEIGEGGSEAEPLFIKVERWKFGL